MTISRKTQGSVLTHVGILQCKTTNTRKTNKWIQPWTPVSETAQHNTTFLNNLIYNKTSLFLAALAAIISSTKDKSLDSKRLIIKVKSSGIQFLIVTGSDISILLDKITNLSTIGTSTSTEICSVKPYAGDHNFTDILCDFPT